MIFTNRTTQMVSEGETCSKDREGRFCMSGTEYSPAERKVNRPGWGCSRQSSWWANRTGLAQHWEGLVRIVPFVRDFPKKSKSSVKTAAKAPSPSQHSQRDTSSSHAEDQPLNIPLSSHLWAKSNQLTRHCARSSAIPGPGACPPAQHSREKSSEGPACPILVTSSSPSQHSYLCSNTCNAFSFWSPQHHSTVPLYTKH